MPYFLLFTTKLHVNCFLDDDGDAFELEVELDAFFHEKVDSACHILSYD